MNATKGLSQQNRLGAFDQELVLRFFALKNYRSNFKHDVGDFLTEYMERVSDPDAQNSPAFDYASERSIFEHTFSVFSASLGDRAFAYATRTGRLAEGFSVYHFEALTLGIQSRLPVLNAADASQMEVLKKLLTDVKLDPEFIKLTTGGGKNSPG